MRFSDFLCPGSGVILPPAMLGRTYDVATRSDRGRFHRDRRGIGRVRDGRAAQRGPGNAGVLLEAGGEDATAGSTSRSAMARPSPIRRSTGATRPSPIPALNGRRVFWPRGKVLGGSSSINGMVYIRGQAEDFDHWRQLGNTGWSFDDVLPYFRRAEHQIRGADELHGTGGRSACPTCRTSTRSARPSSTARRNSAIRATTTSTARRQEGVGYHQTTTRNGRRCSTAVGYLRPAMQAAQSAGRHRRADREDPVRRPPRRRRGVPPGRRSSHRARRARGDPVRRRGQFAATADAVRHRPAGAVWPSSASRSCTICPVSGRACRTTTRRRSSCKCRLPITVNDVMLSNVAEAEGRPANTTCSSRGPLAMRSSPAALFARTRPELATPDVKISIAPFSADRPQDGLHPFPGFSLIAYQLRPESRGEIKLKSARPGRSRRRCIRTTSPPRPTGAPSSTA